MRSTLTQSFSGRVWHKARGSLQGSLRVCYTLARRQRQHYGLSYVGQMTSIAMDSMIETDAGDALPRAVLRLPRIVDVLSPQIQEEITEPFQLSPQERISERAVDPIVNVPEPQIQIQLWL